MSSRNRVRQPEENARSKIRFLILIFVVLRPSQADSGLEEAMMVFFVTVYASPRCGLVGGGRISPINSSSFGRGFASQIGSFREFLEGFDRGFPLLRLWAFFLEGFERFRIENRLISVFAGKTGFAGAEGSS